MQLNGGITLRKKVIATFTLLIIGLIILGSLKVYHVRKQGSGSLFWNKDAAYIFINIENRGYSLSFLGFAAEFIREVFPFGASAPTDLHSSTLVLEVTPDSVQHNIIENQWLGPVEPFDAVLYAVNLVDQRGFLKWSGDHFEPTNTGERTRIQGAIRQGEIPSGPSYDNLQGWSKRTVAGDVTGVSSNAVENDAKVTIELDGRSLTFVMNSGFISHQAYIDLQRPGQAPERIWSLDEQAHRVSKKEYQQIFGH